MELQDAIAAWLDKITKEALVATYGQAIIEEA